MDEVRVVTRGVIAAAKLWFIQTLCVIGAAFVAIFVWVNFLYRDISLSFPSYRKLSAVTYEYENEKGGTAVEVVKANNGKEKNR